MDRQLDPSLPENPFVDPVEARSTEVLAGDQSLSFDLEPPPPLFRPVSFAVSEASVESMSTFRIATATAISTAKPSIVTLKKYQPSADHFADPDPSPSFHNSPSDSISPQGSSSWRGPNLSHLINTVRNSREIASNTD
jgi:hypothetical protein